MSENLQAELKQTKPFARVTAEALLSVLRTAAVLEHQLTEVLKPYGITHTQYNVLRILRGAGADGLCGREVGERMVSRVPDVSRLLDRMEETGLISRERDPLDRRHVTARITRKGLALLDQATPRLEVVERARAGQIPTGQLKQLIEVLNTIRGNP
ncbi:MAG TPA: MarR family transcriptional regulator [Gemmatimonadales bacterium]|nr:MarR family transcriptional regulator [Gemmatimonadales bacterium]